MIALFAKNYQKLLKTTKFLVSEGQH